MGGGTIKIVNNTVPLALKRLGYSESEVNEIVNYVDEKGTIEGAPCFKPEHLPVGKAAPPQPIRRKLPTSAARSRTSSMWPATRGTSPWTCTTPASPQGSRRTPEIPIAKSLVDYIFKWLGSKFLTAEEKEAIGIISRDTNGEAPVLMTEQTVASRSAGSGTPPRATSAARSW